MDNRKPLRTLYIVQLVTIIILVLLLIQQVLPFFGIAPIGAHPQIIRPGQQSVPGGGYISPSSQQVGNIDHSRLTLNLN
jgi:uncharacterized membrane protein